MRTTAGLTSPCGLHDQQQQIFAVTEFECVPEVGDQYRCGRGADGGYGPLDCEGDSGTAFRLGTLGRWIDPTLTQRSAGV